MRMMNVPTGTMVKVVGKQTDRLVVVHPETGDQVEVPANLYITPPRCVAERDERRDRQERRWRVEIMQAIAERKREELAMLDMVRSGEMEAIIYKDRVFPDVRGDRLADRLLVDIAHLTDREKRRGLKKKIEMEMLRRCKWWTVDEVFGQPGG